MKDFPLAAALLLWPLLATAQLAVTVSPVKATGQKAVVPLALTNGFAEKIESARAACLILDDQGKMVAQTSRWIIGGSEDKAGLAPGATNAFHFVVGAAKPFATTNLTAKVTLTRLVLEGGKVANARKVTVTSTGK